MTEMHRIPLSNNWFNPRTSVVYRAFAENGDLLYVGVTYNPADRFYFHEFQSGFWWHVDRVEVSQEFMDRWVAEEAEAKAIRDLKPICNSRYPGVPEWAEDIELEFRPYEYVNSLKEARQAWVDRNGQQAPEGGAA